MDFLKFLRYERRLFSKAWDQTWTAVKQHVKGLVWTISTPIGLVILLYLIPTFKPVFSGGGLIQEWLAACVGIVVVLIFVIFVFAKNIILASYQDTEKLGVLEEERIPKIIVSPTTGKPISYEKNELSAWAELEITNISTFPLQEVTVQILETVLVLEKQDTRGSYFLHQPSERWNPSSVFWSGRTGPAGEFSRSIPPKGTQYATIAFHPKPGSGLGTFNTLTHPPMQESKITIEVSSPNINAWRGTYYIEYHPASTDDFEFIEWDEWCRGHDVIEG